jgi:hypothetical protein
MLDLTTLKPNELIRLAIKDMKATIAQGITIDMSTWGENIGTVECSVCFAGSIMLQQGEKVLDNKKFDPYDECEEDNNQPSYSALDKIRRGDLNGFCIQLKIDIPKININGVFFQVNELNVKYIQGKEEDFYNKMEAIAKLWD